MKRICLKNTSVLFAFGLSMFVCGMAYEHYTSAYAIDELRASVLTCPRPPSQLQADAR
jgi:hypothetical protein